jgi:hypothetical protein
MRATVIDTDAASVRSKSIRAAKTSAPKRGPIWPILVISSGLLATLAWDGFLAWAVGRMIGAF